MIDKSRLLCICPRRLQPLVQSSVAAKNTGIAKSSLLCSETI